MNVERADKKSKENLTILLFFLAIGFACWFGLLFSVSPAALFEAISEKSAVLVGLISAPGVVTSLTLRRAESRSCMAVAMAFFLIALLALFLISISPLEGVMPADGGRASHWLIGLPGMFIIGVFIMVGSLMGTLKAHMLEGEGEVIPYPSTKSDVER